MKRFRSLRHSKPTVVPNVTHLTPSGWSADALPNDSHRVQRTKDDTSCPRVGVFTTVGLTRPHPENSSTTYVTLHPRFVGRGSYLSSVVNLFSLLVRGAVDCTTKDLLTMRGPKVASINSIALKSPDSSPVRENVSLVIAYTCRVTLGPITSTML